MRSEVDFRRYRSFQVMPPSIVADEFASLPVGRRRQVERFTQGLEEALLFWLGRELAPRSGATSPERTALVKASITELPILKLPVREEVNQVAVQGTGRGTYVIQIFDLETGELLAEAGEEREIEGEHLARVEEIVRRAGRQPGSSGLTPRGQIRVQIEDWARRSAVWLEELRTDSE